MSQKTKRSGFHAMWRVLRLFAVMATASLFGAGHALALASEEDRPIKVIMPLWGPSIQADGTGMFVDIFRFVLQGHEDEFEIDYVSYDKALRLLLYSDVDCAFPIGKPSVLVSMRHQNPEQLVQSAPVLISRTYLFSRPGMPLIRDLKSLEDKLLIQIRGENYNHNFKTSQARFWNVDSEIDKVKVLLEGRGDAMLGSMPEIMLSFNELGVDVPPYDPDFSVLDYENAMTCRNTKRGQAFVSLFSKRVSAALEDGSLRGKVIEGGVPELIVDAFLPSLND